MLEGANFTPLIVGVIALITGWAFGFFDSNNRTSKKIKQAEDKAEAVIRQVKMDAERASAAQTARQPVLPTPSDPSLLRLFQNADGAAKLELDGAGVDTTDISDLARKRLIALISLMRPWVEGKASAALAPTTAPAPIPAATPEIRPVTIMSSLVNVTGLNKKDKPPAPLSMIQQIDEILQTRLASGPLAGRGIKLTESPDSGVTVTVGVQKFSGLSDVPDAEIQSEIRAAIADWEKKYG